MYKNFIISAFILIIVVINFSVTKNVFAGDYYTDVHFDTATDGAIAPTGITAYNDFFWVVDEGNDEVYKFNPDGTYAGVSFDTAGSGAANPSGIVAYNDFFWITDPVDNEVYKYNPDGTYTSVSFDTTASGAADASDITTYNGFLWLMDANDDEVYKYNPDGTYTSVSFDTSSSGGGNFRGMTVVDAVSDYFYFVDWTEAEVYQYGTDGTYTGLHFDVSTEDIFNSHGIVAYNDFLWIVDNGEAEVYKYTNTEAVNPTISTLSPTDEATNVSTLSNLVITFNEYADSATGNVTIYKASDNSVVEAIDVEGAQVTGEGTTIITINPSSNLSQSTSYYVQIDATAFDDLAGNSFAGIADATTWNFTTGAQVHDGIERVSVSSLGVEGNASSIYPSMSSNGRYVAFYSSATNLVAGDTNVANDIFVYDRTLNTLERISVSSAEIEGDGASDYPRISADGNYVVFASYATNLVADDINGVQDVFLRDIALGTTTRISVDSNEVESDGDAYSAYISSDGNFITFVSDATNLVAGDTNGQADIFLRDIALGTTTRISVDSDEVEGDGSSDGDIQSMSSDNNLIVFAGTATNLVAGDTNGVQDIFLRNVTLGTTTRISVDSDEVEGDGPSNNPMISADGNYVVFESDSTNLVADDTNGVRDIFLRDIALGTTTRISVDDLGVEADGDSYYSTISPDGQYIAFVSNATNLVNNDTNALFDVFLYDRDNQTVVRISVDDDGNQISASNEAQSRPTISEDNQYITFDFYTEINAGLVEDDTNDVYDVFVVYFDRVEEAEPEVVVQRSSSGSSLALRNRLLNTPLVLPNTDTPKDCLPSYKFSPSTGQSCVGVYNPNTSPLKFTFLNNLSSNTIHPDVKELQKYLNTHGFPVALVGAGSLGNETTKFGALTKAALIKFQQSKNITPPVGFFGPITRGIVNSGN
ncbi:MAG: hypothetical protein QG583_100 [Patescibacteria group bacterium]|nr:hypothetical protein [Patescibacteria group bacterium]